MQIGLIGLGNMGTAIGNLITHNGHDVLGWEYNETVINEINTRHTNNKFLPGVTLQPNLVATDDLRRVVEECSVIFIAIPSVFIQPTLEPVRDSVLPETLLVNMAKGIDAETGLTSFQMVERLFPNRRRVMLSGPSIANEFAQKMPTTVIIAGEQADLLAVAHLLDNDYFRTRFSGDTMGVELGGILKNVYAIGLGLFDGQNIRSFNFRAAYLTIALEEIVRFGVGMGAKQETFMYLAGLGDLLATSFSDHSHNRRLGERLAKGITLADIKTQIGLLPEGYNTLKTILYIAEKLHISLPLAKRLSDVINGHIQAKQFIRSFIKDFVD